MSYHYELEDILSDYDELLRSDSMLTGLYQSSESLCTILSAILQTNGENWIEHTDIDWTPEEKKQYTVLFQPYIQSIISFFSGVHIMKRGQHGGVEEIPIPDEMAEKVLSSLDEINKAVYGIAKESGIVKLQSDADQKEDIHIFAPIAPAGLAIGGPIAGPKMSKALTDFAVPLRSLLTIIYLFLDMVRIGSAATGKESSRKFLSVAVGVFDFLQGDWKKAIMTFAGYFDKDYVFMGTLGKLYLTLFQTLSPRIQDNFIFGTFNALKSFCIGALLTIFKIVAPYDLRVPVLKALETIATNKKAVDSILEGEGLNPLPDYMEASYDKLGDLQGIMDDPAFICSNEYKVLLDGRTKSKILDMLLTMQGIPLTPKFEQAVCGERKPFLDLVVERQTKKKRPTGATGQTVSSFIDEFLAKNTAKTLSEGVKGLIEEIRNTKGSQPITDETKKTLEALIATPSASVAPSAPLASVAPSTSESSILIPEPPPPRSIRANNIENNPFELPKINKKTQNEINRENPFKGGKRCLRYSKEY